jgi:hypothetical protein
MASETWTGFHPVPFHKLVRGSVVWTYRVDDEWGGNTKDRGVIVFHPSDPPAIAKAEKLAAVCISTEQHADGTYVPLPWNALGGPPMGLDQECAAACHWLTWIERECPMRIMGQTPPELLGRILAEIMRAHKVKQARAVKATSPLLQQSRPDPRRPRS